MYIYITMTNNYSNTKHSNKPIIIPSKNTISNLL